MCKGKNEERRKRKKKGKMVVGWCGGQVVARHSDKAVDVVQNIGRESITHSGGF
jgi:hypothetical protein